MVTFLIKLFKSLQLFRQGLKIQVLSNQHGQWYFRYVANTGRIVCLSDVYTSQGDALNAAYAYRRQF